MLFNLIPFQMAAFAEGDGADVTDVLTDLVAVVSQAGVTVEENGTLTSTEPIRVEITFGVPVEGDEPTPANPVQKGDTATFQLSSAFSLALGYVIDLEASDGTLVGHATLKKDEGTGMVYAHVTFDGADEVFDGTNNSVSCGFKADFEYDGSGEGGSPGDHQVIILEKTYTVNVPPLEITYEVTKSGSENLAEKYIEWEVTVAATQGGVDIDLAGYIFSDDLAAVGAYIDGSFKVGAGTAAPAVEGGKISYVFPEGSISPLAITFRTVIPDSAYLATTEQSVTNLAQLLDSEEELITEGGTSVSFTPEWIKKTGELSGEYIDGVYNSTDRTITWTIIANQMEASMQNVVITDVLPVGLTWVSANWQKWEVSDWGSPADITPDGSGSYALGDISTKVRLTIVTSVPDEDYTAGITTYSNSASFSWEGLPQGTTAPGDSEGIGVGYVPIAKSGEVEDTAKGIITWTVTVDPKGQTIPSLKVYDLLVYGKSINFNEVQGIPNDIATANLTPHIDQKYIENTFVGTSLNLVVHPITLEGERVADLLEITGFGNNEASFSFQSQITDPNIFAGNKSSTLKNTAVLFSGIKYLNKAYGEVEFISKTLAKEMLKRGHLDDPAGGVNEYTTTAGDGFDYQDKSVIFRLSINADGLDFTGMKDAAGNILGTATVTDTLPADWEFVNIVDGSKYLIFAGEKLGSTVKATGAPLVPDSSVGFNAIFGENVSGQATATFTFDKLDQPYVILVKAKPNDTTLAEYFSNNATWTRTNTLSLKAENWTPGVFTYRDVTIVSKILDKTLELPEDGVLKWVVEYRPYDLPGGGTKIFDKLPEGIELRTDAGGNLLVSGNITAHELTLNSNGSYSERDEVTLIIGENITYDNAERELTFYIPDQSKAYRFTYLTDITGEPGKITNKVVLYGETDEQGETDQSYVITQKDGWATMLRNGWMEISKIDGSTGEFLEGAEFTLYASDGETFLRKGVTGADGTLKFKVIPDGEYIFRETSSPAGYTAEEREHTLFVETVGGAVNTAIDGKSGADANKITVKNYEEGTAGNLTITKAVAGNGADNAKEFEFTVTFAGTTDSYDYFGSGGAPDGAISSGGTVTLAHGQSITITGLPKGTEYTVSEGDYRLEGYVTATDGGETGTIVADETAKVTFTNTRNVGSLTISKTVAGNAGDGEKEFEFTVTFDPPEGMPDSYPYSGPAGAVITSGNTITLAHGQSITITEIPEGTEYGVTEVDYTDEGYVTAVAGASGVITVGDDDELPEYFAEFTNTRNEGPLVIRKTVAGARGDKERPFTFIVYLEASGGYRYWGSKTGTIESGQTVTLKHGEYIVIEGLLAGTSYRVTEVEANQEGYCTTYTGTVGEITTSGKTADFVNTKVDLPRTGAGGLNTAWGMLLCSLFVLFTAGGLFLVYRNRRGLRSN